jgi:hypothetical protein
MQLQSPILKVLAICCALLLVGCGGTYENDARTYQKVFGQRPPPDTKVAKSIYWRSPHFTMEYAVFMEIAPGTGLVAQLTNAFPLVGTNLSANWMPRNLALDRPKWFLPNNPTNYDVWLWKNDAFRDAFLLARDRITGSVFFCDEQL